MAPSPETTTQRVAGEPGGPPWRIRLHTVIGLPQQEVPSISPGGREGALTAGERRLSSAIGVLVFHERESLRSGLREMLRPYRDIVIVGEAVNAEAAVDQTTILKPDVVLIDVEMPLVDGADCIRRIRETSASTQVVLVSIYLSQHRVVEGLRAGARAYVSSEWRPDDLAAAIRTAHRGSTSIPAVITGELLRAEGASSDATLTPREGEILRLLERGAPNKEIAAQLWISERTVKFHLVNLYQTLGVATRTQAVHEARHRGVLS